MPSWSGTECFDCLLRVSADHCFGQRFEISGSEPISSTSLATAFQKSQLNSAAAGNQIGLRDRLAVRFKIQIAARVHFDSYASLRNTNHTRIDFWPNGVTPISVACSPSLPRSAQSHRTQHNTPGRVQAEDKTAQAACQRRALSRHCDHWSYRRAAAGGSYGRAQGRRAGYFQHLCRPHKLDARSPFRGDRPARGGDTPPRRANREEGVIRDLVKTTPCTVYSYLRPNRPPLRVSVRAAREWGDARSVCIRSRMLMLSSICHRFSKLCTRSFSDLRSVMGEAERSEA
jgi:hypothetical protein